MRYAFIKDHTQEHPVRLMCQVLDVHPSGFYAWCANPLSARSKENQAVTGKIKQCWLESGTVYGYRKIHDDLRSLGIMCGQQRVRRLMKIEGLRSQAGYRRRPNSKPGEAAAAAPNVLDRQFEVPHRMILGWSTSPTSRPSKAGCIWQSSLICSHEL